MGFLTSDHHNSNDFAGVVARALLGKPDRPLPDSNSTDSDDTLSLSYEEALKKHARRPLIEGMSRIGELAAAELEARRAPLTTPSFTSPMDSSPIVAPTHTKASSITLRMSKDESAMLRKRAAAAGISVSAYIRSCIFESEELRAQVKNALAEIRLSRAAHHG